MRRLRLHFAGWGRRRWVAAAVATLGAGLAIGVPTGIVETGLFTRMTPVRWWDYPLWAASAVLSGLILATYVRSAAGVREHAGRALAGGLGSVFAVGCPVCNKLVVSLLGVSGALNVFGPVQPALGVASVALLGHVLRTRLTGEVRCRTAPLAVG